MIQHIHSTVIFHYNICFVKRIDMRLAWLLSEEHSGGFFSPQGFGGALWLATVDVGLLLHEVRQSFAYAKSPAELRLCEIC
jgi:hypothetical protein